MKTDPETILTLKKDLKSIALTMTKQEVRLLVDCYYAMQENRKRGYNQLDAAQKAGEPNRILSFLATQADDLEQTALKALDYWSADHPVGIWLRQICGIGPVLSAGLLAHTDMVKCTTVSRLWGFSGNDPTEVWEKGKKRPWNASLKTLCWKIGECFVKVSGLEQDYYGKLYLKRKEYEIGRNERGELAAQAAAMLQKVPTHKQRATYKTGKLPDTHPRPRKDGRSLFLSHFWEVYYRHHFKKAPPTPWIIEHGGHVDQIPLPHPFPVPATKKERTTSSERTRRDESTKSDE
jgi:hypothetical protein